MENFRNNPRYSSINIESACIFKNSAPSKIAEPSGIPTISKFGFTFGFKTKPQHKEILGFLKTYKESPSVIDEVLNVYSPKEAAKVLKSQFNFSNNLIKSLI